MTHHKNKNDEEIAKEQAFNLLSDEEQAAEKAAKATLANPNPSKKRKPKAEATAKNEVSTPPPKDEDAEAPKPEPPKPDEQSPSMTSEEAAPKEASAKLDPKPAEGWETEPAPAATPAKPRFADLPKTKRPVKSVIDQLFDEAEAAQDYEPIPRGAYNVHLLKWELVLSSKKGTPGVKLTFQIIDGEHKGRKLWYDLWLTPNAVRYTKRELTKLGVTSLDMVRAPAPRGMRCQVKVALRVGDDGVERNEVRGFVYLGQDPDPLIDQDFVLDDQATNSEAPTGG